jgi:exodeoxyribonuclease VII large subunit
MTLSVSQLVEVINTALTPLETVVVEGEVDEFKIIHGKWVTFKIRDEQSSIGCFMPMWQYRTQVEDGMLVRVQGRPTLRNKGFFSFVLTSLQPTGEGALKRAFELLRTKLTREGLFSADRKRPLPRFPEHIVLITSRDAAAYSDFIKVLTGRQGGLRVSFLHTQVQGEPAVPQILQALEFANTELPQVDALVLVRGGGSLEDLHAFNDERVVRAVAASRIPTIVGIGHERDVSLAELVADVRASTPSNSAELLVASREELLVTLHAMTARLRHRMLSATAARKNALVSLRQSLLVRWRETLDRRQRVVHDMQRLLISLSPTATLKRGYSITRTSKGKVIRSTKQVTVGDALTITITDGDLAVTAK